MTPSANPLRVTGSPNSNASMTHQIVYSSKSTMPMQSDDLEELLVHARNKNAAQGISGALVYAEGVFLQIIEGDAVTVQVLMERIMRDVRHDTVAVLRQGEVSVASFSNWNMAYVSATRAQVARWAGISSAIDIELTDQVSEDQDRTEQFAKDILALLESEKPTP